jgi:hypothetical protein
MESKYKSLAEWRKADPSGYESARTRDLIVKICETFGWEYKPNTNIKPKGYWTLEKCKLEALKYEKRGDWEKFDGSSYSVAKYNGWYKDCVAHMPLVNKPTSHWSIKENVLTEALRYEYKEDWKKNSYGSHSASRRNGWYKECVEHMIPVKSKWNKESLLEEANKYKTTSEFLKYSNGAYQTAIKLYCLEYVTQNLKDTRQIKWTIERCKLESIKYDTRGEWQKKSNTSYNSARKYGWLDDCTSHMINGYLKKNK